MSTEIVKKGTITKVSDTSVTVRLDSDTGDCGGCAIAALCNKAEEVTIPYIGADKSMIGRKVRVESSSSTRPKAMFLYLVIPIVLIVLGLGVSIDSGLSQTMASLVTLAALVLWYLILFVLRSRVSKPSGFKISEIA